MAKFKDYLIELKERKENLNKKRYENRTYNIAQ